MATTKASFVLAALAAVLGLVGIALGQQNYGPPYECVYYYMCNSSVPCSAANGQCNLGTENYNHLETVGDGLGFCLLESGLGCTNFSGNATCYWTNFYDDPAGSACATVDIVCAESTDTGTGCEYGPTD